MSAKPKKRAKKSPAAARELLKQIEPKPGSRTDRKPREGALPRLQTRETIAERAGIGDRDTKHASGTFPIATQDEVDGPLMLELSRIQSQMTMLRDALLAADQWDAYDVLDDLCDRLDRAANDYDARVLSGRHPAKRQALIGGAS
jgi:hypothetical protein